MAGFNNNFNIGIICNAKTRGGHPSILNGHTGVCLDYVFTRRGSRAIRGTKGSVLLLAIDKNNHTRFSYF
jgi:hypothetical protein